MSVVLKFVAGPLGTTLFTDPTDGSHHFKNVLAGGQAESAGAKHGDLILSIDGTSASCAPPYGEMSHADIISLLKGASRPFNVIVGREAPVPSPSPIPKVDATITNDKLSYSPRRSPSKSERLPQRDGVVENEPPVKPELVPVGFEADKTPLLAIALGFRPCVKIYEDEIVMVILAPHPFGPLTKGHCILFPKKQYKTIEAMTEDDIAVCFACLPKVIRSIKDATGVNECTVVMRDEGKAADEEEHVHFHIIPRYPNDQIFVKDLVVEVCSLHVPPPPNSISLNSFTTTNSFNSTGH
jgi:histidine triad (HIT) family protein